MATGRVSHAYLISGPERVGKTTLALAFAQALNCLGSDRPCGQCRSCRLVASGRFSDVRTVQAPAREEAARAEEARERSHMAGRVIKIEQIKELQRDAALLPYEGRCKVYIILNADEMNAEAQNCLLKTLEEPPPAVVLILNTTSASMLLPTVMSRCQQINLGLLSPLEIEQALCERWGVEAERARFLARICGGRIGWAIEAASDPEVEAGRAQQLDTLRRLLVSTYGERFEIAERLASQPTEALARVLDLWLGWWRDLLLVRGKCTELVTNIDCVGELAELAERWTIDQISAFIGSIQTTRQYLYQNVNHRLALEVLMLDLPSPGATRRPLPVGRPG